MRTLFTLWCVWLWGTVAAAAAPALTPEQIEADWLRQAEVRNLPASGSAVPKSAVTVQQDARGGVDGIKNGQWGFHTENEEKPWWQVDLGSPLPLETLTLFNRCDTTAARTARILVLLSDDGKSWQQAYQHDGHTFYGFTDGRPLVVDLGGHTARFVRLQLPGKSYFHLDEVEIRAAGHEGNVALGRPATQSSVSHWSATHEAATAAAPPAAEYRTDEVIDRGMKLAAALQRMGVDVEPQATRLRQAGRETASDAPDRQRERYLRAHWAVREMALKNPLLDFPKILFVKRAPAIFPHMSDQHYGWWSRPGGGIFLLEGFRGHEPQVRCLTADMPEGSFLGPDLSYDGTKLLFAYCRYDPHVADMEKVDKDQLPADCFYQIYEMNVDGSGRRQLTRGRYDDFDPRWLPNGQIVFLSTRKGKFLQCTQATTEQTTAATLPDSYVRCGGGQKRPVAVFTLHVMDAEGHNLRPISAFENFEWTPSVAADGRILYARWDYIDRFNGPYISLWSTNTDGTNAQLVYGNYTVRPQCVFEARSIPGSRRLVFTASGHHSITGGSLCLLDRTRGTEEERPIQRLTPEVCFPETEGWPASYYANPYPLSEEFFLVAWSDRKLPPHRIVTDETNPPNALGVYLYDAFGNLELLYRDAAISSQYPLPVAPRVRPPVRPDTVAWQGPQEGRFLVQDVYRGLEGVARGSIQRLQIVAVPPKVQPEMNKPVLGVSREDPGKFLLGTVPVERDGSAYFRVPSGLPVFFQALDERGLAVETMRSLSYVQPDETQSCIGCHEHRDLSPPVARPPLAALREPSRIVPGPEGTWPLRFADLVQPVLDRRCVKCHRDGADDANAAKLDLTAAAAYKTLIGFAGEDLKKKAFERVRSTPGDCTAANSRLYQMLSSPAGHEGVTLGADELRRLAIWMDLYAQDAGSFSPQQEEELRQLRAKLAGLLEPGAQ